MTREVRVSNADHEAEADLTARKHKSEQRLNWIFRTEVKLEVNAWVVINTGFLCHIPPATIWTNLLIDVYHFQR